MEEEDNKFSNMWNDINLSKKEEIEDILNQKAIFGALLILILISICLSVSYFIYFLLIFGYFWESFFLFWQQLQITTTSK